jgi:hypothetical protein
VITPEAVVSVEVTLEVAKEGDLDKKSKASKGP